MVEVERRVRLQCLIYSPCKRTVDSKRLIWKRLPPRLCSKLCLAVTLLACLAIVHLLSSSTRCCCKPDGSFAAALTPARNSIFKIAANASSKSTIALLALFSKQDLTLHQSKCTRLPTAKKFKLHLRLTHCSALDWISPEFHTLYTRSGLRKKGELQPTSNAETTTCLDAVAAVILAKHSAGLNFSWCCPAVNAERRGASSIPLRLRASAAAAAGAGTRKPHFITRTTAQPTAITTVIAARRAAAAGVEVAAAVDNVINRSFSSHECALYKVCVLSWVRAGAIAKAAAATAAANGLLWQCAKLLRFVHLSRHGTDSAAVATPSRGGNRSRLTWLLHPHSQRRLASGSAASAAASYFLPRRTETRKGEPQRTRGCSSCDYPNIAGTTSSAFVAAAGVVQQVSQEVRLYGYFPISGILGSTGYAAADERRVQQKLLFARPLAQQQQLQPNQRHLKAYNGVDPVQTHVSRERDSQRVQQQQHRRELESQQSLQKADDFSRQQQQHFLETTAADFEPATKYESSERKNQNVSCIPQMFLQTLETVDRLSPKERTTLVAVTVLLRLLHHFAEKPSFHKQKTDLLRALFTTLHAQAAAATAMWSRASAATPSSTPITARVAKAAPKSTAAFSASETEAQGAVASVSAPSTSSISPATDVANVLVNDVLEEVQKPTDSFLFTQTLIYILFEQGILSTLQLLLTPAKNAGAAAPGGQSSLPRWLWWRLGFQRHHPSKTSQKKQQEQQQRQQTAHVIQQRRQQCAYAMGLLLLLFACAPEKGRLLESINLQQHWRSVFSTELQHQQQAVPAEPAGPLQETAGTKMVAASVQHPASNLVQKFEKKTVDPLLVKTEEAVGFPLAVAASEAHNTFVSQGNTAGVASFSSAPSSNVAALDVRDRVAAATARSADSGHYLEKEESPLLNTTTRSKGEYQNVKQKPLETPIPICDARAGVSVVLAGSVADHVAADGAAVSDRKKINAVDGAVAVNMGATRVIAGAGAPSASASSKLPTQSSTFSTALQRTAKLPRTAEAPEASTPAALASIPPRSMSAGATAALPHMTGVACAETLRPATEGITNAAAVETPHGSIVKEERGASVDTGVGVGAITAQSRAVTDTSKEKAAGAATEDEAMIAATRAKQMCSKKEEAARTEAVERALRSWPFVQTSSTNKPVEFPAFFAEVSLPLSGTDFEPTAGRVITPTENRDTTETHSSNHQGVCGNSAQHLHWQKEREQTCKPTDEKQRARGETQVCQAPNRLCQIKNHHLHEGIDTADSERESSEQRVSVRLATQSEKLAEFAGAGEDAANTSPSSVVGVQGESPRRLNHGVSSSMLQCESEEKQKGIKFHFHSLFSSRNAIKVSQTGGGDCICKGSKHSEEEFFADDRDHSSPGRRRTDYEDLDELLSSWPVPAPAEKARSNKPLKAKESSIMNSESDNSEESEQCVTLQEARNSVSDDEDSKTSMLERNNGEAASNVVTAEKETVEDTLKETTAEDRNFFAMAVECFEQLLLPKKQQTLSTSETARQTLSHILAFTQPLLLPSRYARRLLQNILISSSDTSNVQKKEGGAPRSHMILGMKAPSAGKPEHRKESAVYHIASHSSTSDSLSSSFQQQQQPRQDQRQLKETHVMDDASAGPSSSLVTDEKKNTYTISRFTPASTQPLICLMRRLLLIVLKNIASLKQIFCAAPKEKEMKLEATTAPGGDEEMQEIVGDVLPPEVLWLPVWLPSQNGDCAEDSQAVLGAIGGALGNQAMQILEQYLLEKGSNNASDSRTHNGETEKKKISSKGDFEKTLFPPWLLSEKRYKSMGVISEDLLCTGTHTMHNQEQQKLQPKWNHQEEQQQLLLKTQKQLQQQEPSHEHEQPTLRCRNIPKEEEAYLTVQQKSFQRSLGHSSKENNKDNLSSQKEADRQFGGQRGQKDLENDSDHRSTINMSDITSGFYNATEERSANGDGAFAATALSDWCASSSIPAAASGPSIAPETSTFLSQERRESRLLQQTQAHLQKISLRSEFEQKNTAEKGNESGREGEKKSAFPLHAGEWGLLGVYVSGLCSLRKRSFSKLCGDSKCPFPDATTTLAESATNTKGSAVSTRNSITGPFQRGFFTDAYVRNVNIRQRTSLPPSSRLSESLERPSELCSSPSQLYYSVPSQSAHTRAASYTIPENVHIEPFILLRSHLLETAAAAAFPAAQRAAAASPSATAPEAAKTVAAVCAVWEKEALKAAAELPSNGLHLLLHAARSSVAATRARALQTLLRLLQLSAEEDRHAVALALAAAAKEEVLFGDFLCQSTHQHHHSNSAFATAASAVAPLITTVAAYANARETPLSATPQITSPAAPLKSADAAALATANLAAAGAADEASIKAPIVEVEAALTAAGSRRQEVGCLLTVLSQGYDGPETRASSTTGINTSGHEMHFWRVKAEIAGADALWVLCMLSDEWVEILQNNPVVQREVTASRNRLVPFLQSLPSAALTETCPPRKDSEPPFLRTIWRRGHAPVGVTSTYKSNHSLQTVSLPAKQQQDLPEAAHDSASATQSGGAHAPLNPDPVSKNTKDTSKSSDTPQELSQQLQPLSPSTQQERNRLLVLCPDQQHRKTSEARQQLPQSREPGTIQQQQLFPNTIELVNLQEVPSTAGTQFPRQQQRQRSFNIAATQQQQQQSFSKSIEARQQQQLSVTESLLAICPRHRHACTDATVARRIRVIGRLAAALGLHGTRHLKCRSHHPVLNGTKRAIEYSGKELGREHTRQAAHKDFQQDELHQNQHGCICGGQQENHQSQRKEQRTATLSARINGVQDLAQKGLSANHCNEQQMLPHILLKERHQKTPRGIRILCLDGGGSRGVLSLMLLQQLMDAAGCEVYEAFDLIGGTSTGGVIAALLGLKKTTVAEAAQLYDSFLQEVFVKNSPAVTGARLILRQAMYDEKAWEALLHNAWGEARMIDFAADPSVPHVFCVATTTGNSPEIFLCRNYNYPPSLIFSNSHKASDNNPLEQKFCCKQQRKQDNQQLQQNQEQQREAQQQQAGSPQQLSNTCSSGGRAVVNSKKNSFGIVLQQPTECADRSRTPNEHVGKTAAARGFFDKWNRLKLIKAQSKKNKSATVAYPLDMQNLIRGLYPRGMRLLSLICRCCSLLLQKEDETSKQCADSCNIADELMNQIEKRKTWEAAAPVTDQALSSSRFSQCSLFHNSSLITSVHSIARRFATFFERTGKSFDIFNGIKLDCSAACLASLDALLKRLGLQRIKAGKEAQKRDFGGSLGTQALLPRSTDAVDVFHLPMSLIPPNSACSTAASARYKGDFRIKVKDALRATTAAPGFFTSAEISDKRLADGALLANNPTAIALAEAKALWPDIPIELVVSIGTGKVPIQSPCSEKISISHLSADSRNSVFPLRTKTTHALHVAYPATETPSDASIGAALKTADTAAPPYSSVAAATGGAAAIPAAFPASKLRDARVAVTTAAITEKRGIFSQLLGFKGWESLIARLAECATNTESVHQILQVLLPENCYFRLNPTLDEGAWPIDETRVERLDALKAAAFRFLNDENSPSTLRHVHNLILKLQSTSKCAPPLMPLDRTPAAPLRSLLAAPVQRNEQQKPCA